jgi:hypothetical protein
MSSTDIIIHNVIRVIVSGGYKGGDIDEPSKQNYNRSLIIVYEEKLPTDPLYALEGQSLARRGRTTLHSIEITLHTKIGRKELPFIMTAEDTIDEWEALHTDEIKDKRIL